MHSLTPEYLAALRFDGTQAATLRTLGEYQGKQQLYAAQSPEALRACARSRWWSPPSHPTGWKASSSHPRG